LWWRLVTNSLYNLTGRDWAPVIRYDGKKWSMEPR
jgi:hypothetical protein